MSQLTFQTDRYNFAEFSREDRTVLVKIIPVENRGVTEDDVREIEKFLCEIGKWETLVKAGLNLLSELKIVQIEEEAMSYYEREFGPQRYNLRVTRDRFNKRIDVRIWLTTEERRRRGEEVLPIQEVYRQIKNIPKWRNFIKSNSTTA